MFHENYRMKCWLLENKVQIGEDFKPINCDEIQLMGIAGDYLLFARDLQKVTDDGKIRYKEITGNEYKNQPDYYKTLALYQYPSLFKKNEFLSRLNNVKNSFIDYYDEPKNWQNIMYLTYDGNLINTLNSMYTDVQLTNVMDEVNDSQKNYKITDIRVIFGLFGKERYTFYFDNQEGFSPIKFMELGKYLEYNYMDLYLSMLQKYVKFTYKLESTTEIIEGAKMNINHIQKDPNYDVIIFGRAEGHFVCLLENQLFYNSYDNKDQFDSLCGFLVIARIESYFLAGNTDKNYVNMRVHNTLNPNPHTETNSHIFYLNDDKHDAVSIKMRRDFFKGLFFRKPAHLYKNHDIQETEKIIINSHRVTFDEWTRASNIYIL